MVCEICGSIEEVSQTKGWVTTLCKKCKDKYEKKQKERLEKYKKNDSKTN